MDRCLREYTIIAAPFEIWVDGVGSVHRNGYVVGLNSKQLKKLEKDRHSDNVRYSPALNISCLLSVTSLPNVNIVTCVGGVCSA